MANLRKHLCFRLNKPDQPTVHIVLLNTAKTFRSRTLDKNKKCSKKDMENFQI